MNAALQKITRARVRREKAERDLSAAVLEARAAGATLQQIADAAGVTRQRIYQIMKKRSDN